MPAARFWRPSCPHPVSILIVPSVVSPRLRDANRFVSLVVALRWSVLQLSRVLSLLEPRARTRPPLSPFAIRRSPKRNICSFPRWGGVGSASISGPRSTSFAQLDAPPPHVPRRPPAALTLVRLFFVSLIRCFVVGLVVVLSLMGSWSSRGASAELLFSLVFRLHQSSFSGRLRGEQRCVSRYRPPRVPFRRPLRRFVSFSRLALLTNTSPRLSVHDCRAA
jgi:hypothetical protein